MNNLSENNKYKNLMEVKQRIDKNYQFIKELEQLILCEDNDLDKLRIISFIGYLYSSYITGQYASSELEKEIIYISNKLPFVQKNKPNKNCILIVMTESGAVGGHSVLVNNWIRWDTENHYSVVFTEQGYSEVVDFIKESVSVSDGSIYCLEGDYITKAKKLMDISQNYEKIMLFTHMYDVVPILAYGNKNWKNPVLFYNHADFRFSFGFSIADNVLNITPYDCDKTKRFRGVPNDKSIVFRFPNGGKIVKNEEKTATVINDNDRINKRHILAEKYGFQENEKLIVSAGADFKYENILGCSFDQFVRTLLNKYDYKATFLIIGADKENIKWKKLCEETGGKGMALGILPRQEMDSLIEIADLYILSFPMAGTGAMIAEEAKVPYLALFITERGIDTYTNNAARTIEELIEKSLDVLNGNGQNYLGHMKESYECQEEWCIKWKNLLEKVTHHNVTEIKPERLVETQEYVNCQLMQDSASKNVAWYLYLHDVSEEFQRQLFYLDNKYGMNIFHNLEIIEKDQAIINAKYYSDKHLQLYRLAIKWIQLKQAGMNVDSFLLDKGYSSIAIYGMSYMGTTLLNDINPKKLEVRYGIDEKSDKIHASIPLYYPKDDLPEVDAIINTTLLSKDEILNGLKDKDIKILLLSEIIDELSVGRMYG